MGNSNGGGDRDRWARLRFAVVGPLLASPPPAGRLRAELERLSQQDWEHPCGGQVRFSASTIERWFYRARTAHQDPVKALRARPRTDAGRVRAMSAALREQYRDRPSWSAQLHHLVRHGGYAMNHRRTRHRKERGASLIWLVLHVAGGVFAAWVAHHVGARLRDRRPVFSDSVCASCGVSLGWSQLPIVGALRGCAGCGHSGPRFHLWLEVCGGLGHAVAVPVRTAVVCWFDRLRDCRVVVFGGSLFPSSGRGARLIERSVSPSRALFKRVFCAAGRLVQDWFRCAVGVRTQRPFGPAFRRALSGC